MYPQNIMMKNDFLKTKIVFYLNFMEEFLVQDGELSTSCSFSHFPQTLEMIGKKNFNVFIDEL